MQLKSLLKLCCAVLTAVFLVLALSGVASDERDGDFAEQFSYPDHVQQESPLIWRPDVSSSISDDESGKLRDNERDIVKFPV